jgi:threonine/homoserine/homoserine lactone efflux protein
VDIGALLQGLIIGFSIAAPVGPIGVLCIRRTLTDGRAAGLASGLGAATADAIYGCVAGFGLSFISTFLVAQQNWLRMIGGGFLVYLGIKTFRARPAAEAAAVRSRNLAGAYASTFVLTLTNPVTILAFVGIFAGLGLASAAGDYATAGVLVAGVFAGSAGWWLLLSGGVSLFRERFSPRVLQWVNWTSGAVLAGFGAAALIGAIV